MSTLRDIPPTIRCPEPARTNVIVPPTFPLDGRSASNTPAFPIDPFSPAFLACRRITQARARNFYLGLRLAPQPKRAALLALYTWMRHADDLADADGPDDSPRTRLASLVEFKSATTTALAGVHDLNATEHAEASAVAPPMCDEWWPAFIATARTHTLPASLFTDTLAALEADAAGVDHASAEDLARYCDRVAGTVALACVRIWGVRRPELTARAMHVAILRARAVQLTNILRDLREDLSFSPSRSYLPRDSYAAHATTPDDLRSTPDSPPCASLLSAWIDEARSLYDASRPLESLVDPSCARVCWALGAVYESLLASIARRPALLVTRRISVPRRRKLSIALAGWLGVGLPG